MKNSRLATSILVLALGATPASARVDLSWNGCTPDPVHPIEPYTAADHVLTVSITGIDGDYTGVDVTIAILDYCSPEGAYIPQAWRFDPGGCQEGVLRVARPASFDGCPGLAAGGGGLRFETATTERLSGFLAPPDNAVLYFPAEIVRFATTFPTVHLSSVQRYVAGRITFPMGETVAGADPDGVKCGCAAAPRLLTVIRGTPASPLGDLPLQRGEDAHWVDFVGCAIAPNGPPVIDAGSDPACLATAAQPRTWGAVKVLYR